MRRCQISEGRHKPCSPGSNSSSPSAHTRHGVRTLRRPGRPRARCRGTSTCHRGHGAAAGRPDVPGETAGQDRDLPLPSPLGTRASPAGRAAAPGGGRPLAPRIPATSFPEVRLLSGSHAARARQRHVTARAGART